MANWAPPVVTTASGFPGSELAESRRSPAFQKGYNAAKARRAVEQQPAASESWPPGLRALYAGLMSTTGPMLAQATPGLPFGTRMETIEDPSAGPVSRPIYDEQGRMVTGPPLPTGLEGYEPSLPEQVVSGVTSIVADPASLLFGVGGRVAKALPQLGRLAPVAGGAAGFGAFDVARAAAAGGGPAEIAGAGARGVALGGLLGGVGVAARGAPVPVRVGAEIAAFGAGGAALEGRLPTAEDFAHAAGFVLGLKTIHNVPRLGAAMARQARGLDLSAVQRRMLEVVPAEQRAAIGRLVAEERGAIGRRPSEVPGNETVAYGPDPTRQYQMQNRVVELDSLVPSHTDQFAPNPAYPKELQPRMRERGPNRKWVQDTAAKIIPEILIQDTYTLDRGSPIVGPDLTVESGNGRVMALRLASQSYPEQWRAYQTALREALPQFGISPEQLVGMRNPVLVRSRISNVDRVRFASEANQPAVVAMSPLENAIQDARRIRLNDLYTPEETGNLDTTLRLASNRAFIGDFLSTLPANERASLVDSGGELNLAGMQRVKAAMFARTYPGQAGQHLTQIFFESREPIIKKVEDGMMASLPKMAQAEDLVRTGERSPDLTIAEDLAVSLRMLALLKQRKLTVDTFLAQGQMLEREITPFQERLLRHIDEIGNYSKAIRQFLGDYADSVIASPHPQQAAMLAGPRPTKEMLFDATVRREGGLFAYQAPEEIPAAAPAVPPAAERVRMAERTGIPAAEVAPAAREPWQMTSMEFYRSPLAKQMIGKPIGGAIYSGSARPTAAGRNKWFTDQSNKLHESLVRQALAEGKPVPPEVLSDYPDLAARAAPAPAAAPAAPLEGEVIAPRAREPRPGEPGYVLPEWFRPTTPEGEVRPAIERYRRLLTLRLGEETGTLTASERSELADAETWFRNLQARKEVEWEADRVAVEQEQADYMAERMAEREEFRAGRGAAQRPPVEPRLLAEGLPLSEAKGVERPTEAPRAAEPIERRINQAKTIEDVQALRAELTSMPRSMGRSINEVTLNDIERAITGQEGITVAKVAPVQATQEAAEAVKQPLKRQVASPRPVSVIEQAERQVQMTERRAAQRAARQEPAAVIDRANQRVQAKRAAAGEPPPPPPPPPPTGDRPGQPPPPTPSDAIKNIRKAMSTVRRLRPEQLAGYHKRRMELAGRLASLQAEAGGAAISERELGALKGKLPQPEFEAIADQITAADLNAVHDAISASTRLQPFQKVSARTAFRELLGGEMPAESDLAHLEKVVGRELIGDVLKLRAHRNWAIVRDVIGIPRALQTTFDLSYSLRQGAMMAAGHPRVWARSMKTQLKAFGTEEGALLAEETRQSNKFYGLAQEVGLYEAPLRQRAGTAATREEAYASRFISKTPIVGRIMRASERAYVTMGNELRHSVFYDYAKLYEAGVIDLNDLAQTAKVLNYATGRGDLGRLNQASDLAAQVLYSPRNLVAKFQLPTMLISKSPVARKETARLYATSLAAGISLLAFFKLTGLADVSLDTDSTDFGKLRFGPLRIDIWGGYQPIVRYISQIAHGRATTQAGKSIQINRLDTAGRFGRSKLAPQTSIIVDVADGKTFIGDELTLDVPTIKNQLWDRFVPMTIGDIADAWRLMGPGAAIPAGILAALGVGVQAYESAKTTPTLPGAPAAAPRTAPTSAPAPTSRLPVLAR